MLWNEKEVQYLSLNKCGAIRRKFWSPDLDAGDEFIYRDRQHNISTLGGAFLPTCKLSHNHNILQNYLKMGVDNGIFSSAPDAMQCRKTPSQNHVEVVLNYLVENMAARRPIFALPSREEKGVGERRMPPRTAEPSSSFAKCLSALKSNDLVLLLPSDPSWFRPPDGRTSSAPVLPPSLPPAVVVPFTMNGQERTY